MVKTALVPLAPIVRTLGSQFKILMFTVMGYKM